MSSTPPPPPTPWQPQTTLTSAPSAPSTPQLGTTPPVGNHYPAHTAPTSSATAFPPAATPPAPPKSKSKKRILIVVAVLVVVGVIVAATLIGNAISGLTLIDDLESGDCVEEFFEQSNGEFLEVFFVRTVNCETPHAYEVYSSEALWDDSDTFAGSDQTFAVAEAHCLDEYHEFVGGDYYTSDYETWSFAPTSDTWSYGDRTTICLVGSYDGVTLLEGSLRGADA